jgi:hypothetical protein
MAPDVAEVLESARSLGREQIAELAYELLRVLDGDAPEVDQETVDAAWGAELRRRVGDIESGGIELVSHKKTVAQARAMLARQRSDVRR